MQPRRSWRAHVEIMRLDHWIKNLFVLPGVALALSLEPERWTVGFLPRFAIGFFAACLISSSNYVINELLDGPYDLQHPLKSGRPVPRGDVDTRLVLLQWLGLMAAGVGLGLTQSRALAEMLLTLWLCGAIYNIRPVRTKDIPYVDVLSEALNNPVRLAVGWSIVGLPLADLPWSLVLSYWMIGCYLMAVKRYAELRHLGNAIDMARYRPVFAAYTESRLLTAIVVYGLSASTLLAVFAIRHRAELLWSLPLLALVMVVYFRLALQPDSAVQAPEKLYREPLLVAVVTLTSMVMVTLLVVDVP